MPHEPAIQDGIEWYTWPGPDGDVEEEDCQCARCGSSCGWADCHNCGGEGEVEDTRDWTLGGLFEAYMRCDWCRGSGGSWHCLSSPEWCKANPLPGREHIESTALRHWDA